MRFIVWNMGLSAWLLLSAFALGHSPGSAAITGLLAVLIGTFALASPGLPGLRFANTAFALILGFAALLAPEVSTIARFNSAVVAAIVFALSVVPGRSTETPSADPQPKP
jgi:hypothetical protein